MGFASRSMLLISILCCSVVSGQVLPFWDGFDDAHDDGMPVTWRMADNGAGAGGTRAVEDGYFVISGNNYTASWVDGTDAAADVTLEAAINFQESGLWSFGARASAGNVYWGGMWSDGSIFLAETASGVSTFRAETLTAFDPFATDVRLRMKVVDLDDGSVSLSLYAWDDGDNMPEEPQLQHVDNEFMFPNGNIGMVVNSGAPVTANVDYFSAWIPHDADFSNDGLLDCSDVNALTAAIATGTADLNFDLTGDGLVQSDDLVEWLRLAGEANLASGNPYLEGDANLDGVVDVADFNLWNANKFTANASWCDGDFNADGSVDVGDFNLWNASKFTSADAAAVPEPNALSIVFLLLGVVVAHSRRSQR